eukprot:37910-Alexandrium_andersonii.AAC.1
MTLRHLARAPPPRQPDVPRRIPALRPLRLRKAWGRRPTHGRTSSTNGGRGNLPRVQYHAQHLAVG